MSKYYIKKIPGDNFRYEIVTFEDHEGHMKEITVCDTGGGISLLCATIICEKLNEGNFEYNGWFVRAEDLLAR